MESKKIVPPEGLQFADLRLEREPFTKQLKYDPTSLAHLVVANNVRAAQPLTENDALARG